jgi:nucleoside 2-deoxyribosyltransferase
MKIYFAGSIRGGRSDRRIYEQLIKHLRRHGEVLTEHVADPRISEKGENGITDAEIYRKDIEWLSEADLVVAEVTTPSLGVGYEIGLAESLGKPILCLFNNTKGKMLSAMVSGNPHILLRHYTESKEAEYFIDDFINHLSADSALRRQSYGASATKAQATAGQESSEA